MSGAMRLKILVRPGERDGYHADRNNRREQCVALLTISQIPTYRQEREELQSDELLSKAINISTNTLKHELSSIEKCEAITRTIIDQGTKRGWGV